MRSQRNMLALERLFGEGGRLVKETDMFQCNHCDAMVDVTPGKSPSEAGGYCSGCDSVICPECVELIRQDGICEPSEVKLARWERENELLIRWGLDPNTVRRAFVAKRRKLDVELAGAMADNPRLNPRGGSKLIVG